MIDYHLLYLAKRSTRRFDTEAARQVSSDPQCAYLNHDHEEIDE